MENSVYIFSELEFTPYQEEPVWKDLEAIGYPKYMINQHGEIMHSSSGRSKDPSVNQYGTLYVTLYDSERAAKSIPVSRLVARMFIAPESVPVRFNTVIFKDGDRRNVNINNLTYRPRSFAVEYHKHFTNPDRRIDNCAVESYFFEGTSRIRRHPSIDDAARTYGVLPKAIMKHLVSGDLIFPHPTLRIAKP